MTLLDKIDHLEKVSELYLKGYKPSQIARALDISPAMAKNYVEQYKEAITNRVMEDPDFLDRIQDNTLEALEQIDLLIKEAWETYENAKELEMMNQQINLLKVAGDLTDKRNKLLQLVGAKIDSGMTARMQKAEQVNFVVSSIIKDIISQCPNCRNEAQVRLAEAFRDMNRPEEAVELHRVGDAEDAIVIEEEDTSEEEWSDDQQEDMMADILGD